MTVYSKNIYIALHNRDMLLRNFKKVFHFSASPNMARILLLTVLLQSISLFTSESPLYILNIKRLCWFLLMNN